MNRFAGLLDDPYANYARTLLALRIAELRKKMSRGDIGASAIELAVITAIIAVVASVIAIVIKNVVDSKKAAINNLSGNG
jgi:Flp pilus assembly pilin Flp